MGTMRTTTVAYKFIINFEGVKEFWREKDSKPFSFVQGVNLNEFQHALFWVSFVEIGLFVMSWYKIGSICWE